MKANAPPPPAPPTKEEVWQIWLDKQAQAINEASDWVGQLGPGVPAGFLYGCANCGIWPTGANLWAFHTALLQEGGTTNYSEARQQPLIEYVIEDGAPASEFRD